MEEIIPRRNCGWSTRPCAHGGGPLAGGRGMATDNKVSAVSARRLRLSLASMGAWRATDQALSGSRSRGPDRDTGATCSRHARQVIRIRRNSCVPRVILNGTQRSEGDFPNAKVCVWEPQGSGLRTRKTSHPTVGSFADAQDDRVHTAREFLRIRVRPRNVTAERRLYFSPLLIPHNVLCGLTVMSIRGCAAPFFHRSERNAA